MVYMVSGANFKAQCQSSLKLNLTLNIHADLLCLRANPQITDIPLK